MLLCKKDKEGLSGDAAYLPCRNGRMGAADTSGYKRMGFAGVLVRIMKSWHWQRKHFWEVKS